MKASIGETLSLLLKIIYLYLESFYRLIVPPARQDVRGKKVLITGAGHGIGRELSLEFARLGASLILWDINKENNEGTADEVRHIGATVHTYICDVTSTDDVHTIADRVRREVGNVDILVNNAGILYGGPVLDMQEKHIRRTFEVNTLAHFWTVREFLPSMLEANNGVIMNIASSSAKSGTAFLVDYSSSKYAVFGFTEALREEIDRLGKPGVQTTVVCPFFVDTGLCKYPKSRFDPILTPKETAITAIDGMLRGEKEVYVPRRMWLQLRTAALFPEKALPLLKKFHQYGIDPQYNSKSD
ncbi:17-beta-hydroxysteroid dehydrogenase 13-like [Haliotis rubra]|uniref:17-beta-hydroxysteroid dehydrogenase 13-like n=1 Tax=Haliotis rubra TaxID=36100 RepID=UPI001EE56D36|nr:17-beta-hydroxysteroid dehydrogenase 13-like [Haliotis rubra]